MDGVPGFVPRLLRDPGVTLFRADDRVFEAMVDGWRTQMLARGLDSRPRPARAPTNPATPGAAPAKTKMVDLQ